MARRTLAAANKELANKEQELEVVNAEVDDLRKQVKETQAKLDAVEGAVQKEKLIIFDVPHKAPGSRVPACHMGDIPALLNKCPDVEDGNAAYETAQREVHTLAAVAGLNPNQTYKSASKSPEMYKLCKMVRGDNHCPWMRHFRQDWATRRIIQQYMKSTRDNERKKRKARRASSSSGRGSSHDAHAHRGHAGRRHTTSVSVNISQILDAEPQESNDE